MSFSADVGGFGKRAQAKVDLATRKVTLDLFTGVINMSPVGNPTLWKHAAPPGYVGGRFRNSWFTTVGQPAAGGERAPNKGGAEAIAQVLEKVPKGAGQVTYLTNSLPYALRLEYEGWSTQAPAGMVRVNVKRVAGSLKRR